MNKNLRYFGGILFTLLFFFLLWYFRGILVYVIIAGILSFIGQPLVRLLDKIHIKKFKMPHSLSAGLSLIILFLVITSFFLIFVPVITRQADVISRIDYNYLGEQIYQPIQNLDAELHSYKILKKGESLEVLINEQLNKVVELISFEKIFSNIIGFAGSLFIGLFSVLFLTFFFLRDEHLFFNGILLFVPEKYEKQGGEILSETRYLLSRYFTGLVLEVISMMTLITIGLALFGVKNALLIGFLGGLMNIIPYLGPVIGATIGIVIGTTTTLSQGLYQDVTQVIVFVASSFIISNLIDNFVLQPLIYSKSVKAHPIEIFLVILFSASLAGIPGMILAIPSYTVIRIIGKQFFSQVKFVRKLTEDI